MSTPVVRLYLFFAEENSRAVILRRGPSRHFRLILWDRETDDFTDGQWLKHKVWPERCDLSPDGAHFIYFALDGRWYSEGEGAYTAISRPPYFTALALFPEGSTWGGGGRFLDNRHFVATGGNDVRNGVCGLTRVYHRGAGGALSDKDGADPRLTDAARRRYEDGPDRAPLDMYDTQGGRLYRRTRGEMMLIRDFTGMTFSRVRAPYEPSGPGA